MSREKEKGATPNIPIAVSGNEMGVSYKHGGEMHSLGTNLLLSSGDVYEKKEKNRVAKHKIYST